MFLFFDFDFIRSADEFFSVYIVPSDVRVYEKYWRRQRNRKRSKNHTPYALT